MSQYPIPFAGAAEERQKIIDALPTLVIAPKRPRKLLVVSLNVRNGVVGKGHAAIGHGNLAIDLAGQKTGAYAAIFSNDPAIFSGKALAEFDAVCFNNSAGVLTEDPAQRQSIIDFVAGGKGFVGIHAAAATFVQYPKYDQFPPFGHMLGAYENMGHPWGPTDTITLSVDDPGSPLTAAFGGRDFEIQDEVFQFTAPYTREKLRVLLTINTDKTDMGPTRRFLPERLADRDFAMSWIRAYERGRVFYTSLGHNPHIFWNAPVMQHLFAGIQFACGDLECDAKPSAKRG